LAACEEWLKIRQKDRVEEQGRRMGSAIVKLAPENTPPR